MEDECKELQSELTSSRDGYAKLENDFESLSTEFDRMKEELQRPRKRLINDHSPPQSSNLQNCNQLKICIHRNIFREFYLEVIGCSTK